MHLCSYEHNFKLDSYSLKFSVQSVLDTDENI